MAPVLHSPELATVELVSTADPAFASVTKEEAEAYHGGDVMRWRQWTPSCEPIVITVRALSDSEDDRCAIGARAYAASLRQQHTAEGVPDAGLSSGVMVAWRMWRSCEAFRLGAISATRGKRTWTKAEMMRWPLELRREIGAMIIELAELPEPFSEG